MFERVTPALRSTTNERLAMHTRGRKRVDETLYYAKRVAPHTVMT